MNNIKIFIRRRWVAIIILTLIFLFVASIIWSIYCYHHYPDHELTGVNNAVQIAYNFCYSFIAIIVIIIAYDQLRKTREATNIQSLHDIFSRFISDSMKEKRMEFATYILTIEGETFDDKMSKLRTKIAEWSNKTKKDLTDGEIEEIAIVKNKIETILYEFQMIGYLLKRNIFDVSDTYNLFSYELVRYWLLAVDLKYIHYLRFNQINGEIDFYESFQGLFKKCIRNEIFANINLHYCPTKIEYK